jgi:transposase-like protein
MTKHSPFRYFKTSPEIIRLAVMLYVRFPLSLRNVEDLLHERPFRTFAKQNPTGTGYRYQP